MATAWENGPKVPSTEASWAISGLALNGPAPRYLHAWNLRPLSPELLRRNWPLGSHAVLLRPDAYQQ